MANKIKYSALPAGAVFGYLTVSDEPEALVKGRRMVMCVCSCGSMKRIAIYQLIRGHAKSCGCKQAKTGEAHHGYKHGASNDREHVVWMSMIGRCYNIKDGDYLRYGGRGITVCDRWRNSFLEFISDIGKRPSAKHSLDRINNDGNYEPGNVRWATRLEQARNTSLTRFLVIDDVRRPLKEWSEISGINSSTIRRRIRDGWSVKSAVFKNLLKVKRRKNESQD